MMIHFYVSFKTTESAHFFIDRFLKQGVLGKKKGHQPVTLRAAG